MNKKEKILRELREFVDSSLKHMEYVINKETVRLYWGIGKYISDESKMKIFGDSYIDIIADDLHHNYPQINGFSRSNVYRMKQFYDTYKKDEFVLPYLFKITWTNHLKIFSKTKSVEERHVGIILCASQNEEVVEYAMSRTMSPMMVKDYLTELPDKEVLKNRLEKVVKTSKRITN